MITKRSGKSCGFYSKPHVKIACLAANMFVQPRVNLAEYSCKMDGFLIPQDVL